MAGVYFDWNRSSGGSGTEGSPYGMDSVKSYVISSTSASREIRFRPGLYDGLTSGMTLGGSANNDVTMEPWDTGESGRPTFRSVDMAGFTGGAGAWTRGTLSGTTFTPNPSSGNIYRTSQSFCGLWPVESGYPYGRFGGRKDLSNSSGQGTQTLTANYEWADEGGFDYIYCDAGNPFDVYGVFPTNLISGGMNARLFVMSNWLAAFTMRGLRFQSGHWSVAFSNGSTSATRRDLWVYDNQFEAVWGGVRLSASANSFGDPNAAGAYGDVSFLKTGAGIERVRIEYNLFKEIGRDAVSSFGDGHLNDLRIRRNRIISVCQALSTGGIYLSEAHTTNGRRGLITENFISDVGKDNWYNGDGKALYSENKTQDMRWSRNFVHNCYSGNHVNTNLGNTLVDGNYMLNESAITDSRFCSMGDRYYEQRAGTVWRNNFVRGVDHFYRDVATGYGSPYRASLAFLSNVGVRTGSTTGKYPWMSKESKDRNWMRMDGNRFHGFSAELWNVGTDNDSYGSTNLTALCLNHSSSDPTAALTAYPTTVDLAAVEAGYNPAQMLPPAGWNGTTLPTFSKSLVPVGN